jgi:hypothetical protein
MSKKSNFKYVKRPQKDYSMSFKLSVVGEIYRDGLGGKQHYPATKEDSSSDLMGSFF